MFIFWYVVSCSIFGYQYARSSTLFSLSCRFYSWYDTNPLSLHFISNVRRKEMYVFVIYILERTRISTYALHQALKTVLLGSTLSGYPLPCVYLLCLISRWVCAHVCVHTHVRCNRNSDNIIEISVSKSQSDRCVLKKLVWLYILCLNKWSN